MSLIGPTFFHIESVINEINALFELKKSCDESWDLGSGLKFYEEIKQIQTFSFIFQFLACVLVSWLFILSSHWSLAVQI